MTHRRAERDMQRMPVVDALRVLAEHSSADQIVVTNQGSARIVPKLRRRALDFHYNPSTMGGAIPLALGLALAQPRRQVLVVSGDGSLLMSLGTLVTVVRASAANFTIVLLDNAIYEVTGGQQTPASQATDYGGMARAAGFATIGDFEKIADWRAQASEALNQPGPRFIRLAVDRAPADYLHFPTPPIAEQLAELRRAMLASVEERSPKS